MDLMLPVILVMFAINAALATAIARADPAKRLRRQVRREHDVPIAQIAQGQYVKVTGVVRAVEPMLESPVGRRPCIGFRLVLLGMYDDRRIGGSRPSVPGGVDETSACQRFAIDDGTGTAQVEGPFLIGLDLEGEWSGPVTDLSKINGASSAFVSVTTSSARAHRYREGLLKPGDRVSVRGRASIEVDPAGARIGTRSPPEIVVVRGSTEDPVVVVDAGLATPPASAIGFGPGRK